VYVYPAAEELKHAWTAATMLLAEAPVKKPRARAARARPLVRAAARLVRRLPFTDGS